MGVVEIPLDRVRELRAGRDSGGSQWLRPELYDSFYPKPRQDTAA